MRLAAFIGTVLLVAGPATAGPASGTVKSATGTISPKFAIAYVVRDSHHPRQTIVELLLTETAIDPAPPGSTWKRCPSA